MLELRDLARAEVQREVAHRQPRRKFERPLGAQRSEHLLPMVAAEGGIRFRFIKSFLEAHHPPAFRDKPCDDLGVYVVVPAGHGGDPCGVGDPLVDGF